MVMFGHLRRKAVKKETLCHIMYESLSVFEYSPLYLILINILTKILDFLLFLLEYFENRVIYVFV